jgi:hypothetical protein
MQVLHEFSSVNATLRLCLELTTSFYVLATEDMTTTAQVELGHQAILGIDPVRKTLDCFVMTLISIRKRSAADRASVDEVEQRAFRLVRSAAWVHFLDSHLYDAHKV